MAVSSGVEHNYQFNDTDGAVGLDADRLERLSQLSSGALLADPGHGRTAGVGDPEYGISLGRLLPDHTILTQADVTPVTRQRLQDSLVLVHGGMAQDVGPILEMVTERHLLRPPREREARLEARRLFDEISAALAVDTAPPGVGAPPPGCAFDEHLAGWRVGQAGGSDRCP